MKKVLAVALALTTVLSLNACAPRVGGSNYSVSGAGEAADVQRGVIVAMRPVTIAAKSPEHENEPGVGAMGGALGGALAASSIGGGRGNIAAMGAGALIAGIGGHFIEKGLTDQEGFEYQVKLDNGRLLLMAQGAEPSMRVGQRVLVTQSRVTENGKIVNRGRVIPDNTAGY